MILTLEKRMLLGASLAALLAVSIVPSIVFAQTVPNIQWLQTYGGLRNDEGYGIVQTGDSGFIVAGYTGDTVEPGLPDYHGGFEDAWVLKLDNTGNIVWQKCLGGTHQEEANSSFKLKMVAIAWPLGQNLRMKMLLTRILPG